MAHMPGHVLCRLGYHDEAHEAFLKAHKLAIAYAGEIGSSPANATWDYRHNIDFMIHNLAEAGRIGEAMQFAATSDSSKLKILWRDARWMDAQNIVSKKSSRTGFDAFIDAMAHTSAGRLEAAKTALEELQAAFRSSRSVSRINQSLEGEAEGSLLIAQGKVDEGLARLREAVKAYEQLEYEEPPYYRRSPHETLGHALLAQGIADEALAVFESGLKERPMNGYLLFGVAEARAKLGQTDAAKSAYQACLQAFAKADSDIVPVVKARQAIARFGNMKS